MYKQKSLNDELTVLLDPNEMASDGTIALKSLDFSVDGSLLAYSFSKSGTDWEKIKIRNVETGKDYPETLEGVMNSITSWTYDNKGFFYSVRSHYKQLHFVGDQLNFIPTRFCFSALSKHR